MASIPIVLFWALILWGLCARGPAVLWYVFFSAAAFGTLAVVPPQVTGGVTLLPQSVAAAFLVAKLLLRPNAIRDAMDAAIDPRKFGFLMAFLAIAIVSALVLPRLFAGQVIIVPLRAAGSTTDFLWPTSSNITQPAYLALSISVAIATTVYLRQVENMRVVIRAFCFGGVVVIATGVVDLVTARTGTEWVLAPFRTATYALLTDSTVLGAKRVVGLMAEASAYGPLALRYAAVLYFLRAALDTRVVHPVIYSGVIILLLFMTALSTSTTAYLGLFVLSALIAGNWLRRAIRKRQSLSARRGLFGEFVTAYSGAVVVLLMFLLNPDLLLPITEFVDRMVFQKTGSDSFDERMFWNSTAFDAFLQTYGLGVGAGSARTSSWFVAILSNTGVIGAAFMLAFVVNCLLKTAPAGDRQRQEILLAGKLCILMSLAMSSIAGTTTDFGARTGFLYGMVIAMSARTHRG